jgi:hypothetical protein
MSQFPNDDHELVDFLKQHRHHVPPADPALEEQLFAAIEVLPQQDNLIPFRRSQPRTRRSIVWFVPPALAAGLLVSVVGYRLLMPAKPSATELANLQAFIESSWQGTDEDAPLFNDVTNN